MQKRRQYAELPDTELSPELDRKIRAMTQAADRDIEELQAKARIHSIVRSFLGSRPGLHEYMTTFAERWDRVRDLAIENLAASPARIRLSAARVSFVAEPRASRFDDDFASEMGFARPLRASASSRSAYDTADPIYGRDDPLGMIISVTSWAVLTAQTNEASIAKEASSRGMPSIAVKALSTHLATELSSPSRGAPGQRRRQGR